MIPIVLGDLAWQTTFPHRVAPLPDEWLTGLLLRCDEANSWESGTTFWSVLAKRSQANKRVWKAKSRVPSLVIPHPINMSSLALHLGIAENQLVTTTYREELIRCYDLVDPPPWLLYPSSPFHLCPGCLSEARLLRRILVLPHLRYCPYHQVAFLKNCRCGTPLFPFNQGTPPFTCPSCQLDWSNLPLLQAPADRMEVEKKLFLYLTWLLTQGTSTILKKALSCINDKLAQENEVHLVNGGRWFKRMNRYFHVNRRSDIWLGSLVVALVSLDVSPQEILTKDEHKLQNPFHVQAFDTRSVMAILDKAKWHDRAYDDYP